MTQPTTTSAPTPTVNPTTTIYTDFVNDYTSARQTDQEVLIELGIAIPVNVLTEDLPLWNEFLEIIIEGYASNVISKTFAVELYNAFLETEKDEKRPALDKLHLLLDESIGINETNLVIRTYEIIEEKIQKILPLLSQEEQVEFLKSIDLGVVPEEVQAKLALMQEPVITPEEAELYASDRLAKALDRRRTLDTRKFNTPLSTEDIKNVVDEHEENELEERSNSAPVPTPTVIKPNIQNLLRSPKSTSLDDLLHKGKIDQN
jgi:hypothetical protein